MSGAVARTAPEHAGARLVAAGADAPLIAAGHALYEGTVWHHRRHPEHRFQQRLTMAWIDLDDLDGALASSRLLSAGRGAPAQLRRRDHIGDPALPLADAVRDEVAVALGVRPEGAVHVLTNLRTWGWCFNPLSVFWCTDEQRRAVAQVLVVTNTPWHERHAYVVDRRGPWTSEVTFAKAMHVSPFLPMDLSYTLVDAPPAERVDLRLAVARGDDVVFDAGLVTHRRAFDAAGVRRMLVRHPTVRVSLGIHAQAWKLWRKGTPFQRHPERRARRAPERP